jgi:SAM-dependent methyltransferase
VIVVDSNIPIYLVGANHPNKAASRALRECAITDGEILVTDGEVRRRDHQELASDVASTIRRHRSTEEPGMASQTPDAATRQAFLAQRRRASEERFDTRFAATYDEAWGAVALSHAAMLERWLSATAPGGIVLDAPCGTGKYWPAILASGRRIAGIDQSARMLAEAARKHPGVPTRHLGLQELDDPGAYDAILCADAMEYVGPEDWPSVLARLRDAARPGAPIYLTVELADPAEVAAAFVAARRRGEPVVDGEDLEPDGGYHYFPRREQVLGWLADARLERIDETEGDFYWHLLLRRPGSVE